jgi:hypothetical protein
VAAREQHADLDFGGSRRVLNLPDASDPQEPATKAQLDTGLGGKVPTTRTVNGHALSGDVTVSKSDVGLGNVTNDVQLKAADLDTDGTLGANSDAKVASQKAVKTYVDQIIAASDAMVFKGVIDCSANPNYPAADRGHTYRVSVAGKIGGASGVNVEAGDLLLCLTDSTASGDQATVGTAWSIAQANLDGAVIGPSSVTDGNPAVFDGTTGKLLKQVTFSAFKASLSLVKGDVGLGNVTNDAQVKKAASSTNGAIPTWSGTGGDTLATGGLAAPAGAIVGISDAQVLTNKTIAGGSNTISGIAPSMMDNGSAVSVLGRSANSSGARADIAAGADNTILSRVSGAVGFNSLVYAMIASGAIASAAELLGGTASKLLTAAALQSAIGFTALTDATNISWNFTSIGPNGSVALGGNRTLSNMTNGLPGSAFVVKVTASSSTRTLSLGNQYFPDGSIESFPISIATTETVYVCGFIETSTRFVVTGVIRT